jgi:hypothetical protein
MLCFALAVRSRAWSTLTPTPTPTLALLSMSLSRLLPILLPRTLVVVMRTTRCPAW